MPYIAKEAVPRHRVTVRSLFKISFFQLIPIGLHAVHPSVLADFAGDSDYITGYRLEKAKLLMQNPNLRVAKIAEMVGFRDEKYFSQVFKKQEGVSPKTYRSQLKA
ncbi:helix-turn-helix domain-containing protein [Paenibacillus sp. NEAU-GSW1]|nr:helix-turn-helix domain-containing protein [Paenibacillus sp. NEAU-GSW1]